MRPSRTRAVAALLAALAAGGSAAAQDFGHSFTVVPLALRQQTGETTFSANAYFMLLGIDGSVPAPPTPYTSAIVTGPTGVPDELSAYSTNVFIAQRQFGSLTDLRTAYPAGTYSGVIGPGGPELPGVALPTDYALPASPVFTNYAATRGIDPQQPFTFTFDPFGGSLLDSTVFSVIDTATGATVVLESLDPAATQFVLPAGTLTTGRNYTATLYFVQVADFKLSFSGDYIHVGQVSLDSATTITLTPVPEPATALVVGAAGIVAVGLVRRRSRRSTD
ncbi:MAG TPA: PEP-CTERM sorting domain-containing protein [Gemmataceae bacterium]|nr:PEP-CTERM sorting domain-containing protein [Gemmataceae bacterium]